MAVTIGIVGTGNVARCNYLPFLAKQEDVSLLYVSRTRAKASMASSCCFNLKWQKPIRL